MLRVDANRHPDQPGVLEVSVDYKVRAAQRRDQVVVALQLAEGAPG